MSSPQSSKVDGGAKAKRAKDELELLNELRDLGAQDFYEDEDAFSVDSEAGSAPSRKEPKFEFTDSWSCMRVVRLIATLQILSFAIDNPSMQLPIVFHIVCRGVLYYINQFYSRLFIDAIYVIQYYSHLGIELYNKYNPAHTKVTVEKLNAQQYLNQAGNAANGAAGAAGNLAGSAGSAAGGVAGSAGGSISNVIRTPAPSPHVLFATTATNMATKSFDSYTLESMTKRNLGNSDYYPVSAPIPQPGATVDFISQRNWHAIKHFSHFFLGILFVIMAVLFTLRQWEIYDYTDRKETRMWLEKYIADGWWRRGGLSVALNMFRGAFCMSMFVFFMFALSRGFDVNALPEQRMTGSVVALCACVVFFIWLIGFVLLRATDAAFVRFVSQNVTYTSTVILKKVLKVKVEIGICLMFALFPPVLYNLVQSIFFITDWNDTLASSQRINVNYYVPCYFMAFPPLKIPRIPVDTCPVAYALASDAPQAGKLLYQDLNILQCDSYLGIIFFTTGFICLAFLLFGYWFLICRFILTVSNDFRTSRWTATIRLLMSVQASERKSYNEAFFILDRLRMSVKNEINLQIGFMRGVPLWMIEVFLEFCSNTLYIASGPIACVLSPVTFLLRRIGVLNICFPKKEEEGQITQKQMQLDSFAEEDKTILGFLVRTTLYILYRITPARSFNRGMTNAQKAIQRSKTIAGIRVRIYQTMQYLRKISGKRKKGHTGGTSLGGGIGEMGVDKHAPWRRALTVVAKNESLLKLERRISAECLRAKKEYITDHDLLITVFDRTVNSSGLAMLMCHYHWNRLEWNIVFLLELTIYACMGPPLNYFVDFISRLELYIAVNVIFGAITYVFRPYQQDLDRWLDFMARVLVTGTCVGIIYCHSVTPPGLNSGVNASLYTPWASLSFLTSLRPMDAAIYLLVDILIVFYFYAFIFYILYKIGSLRQLKRSFNNIMYSFHDNVLNSIVNKLDERILGLENMFAGLSVLQQWDDIIREQRRYALIPWPFIRPSNLLSMFFKATYVKWAAAFNLTIENIRSSLGLTLLHITMCSADGEVSRWIIHHYPSLLSVEDMQRDTPVTVALKQTAYYLLKYAEMNDGDLDDNTSYSDAHFNSCYPEMEQYRDQCTYYGEHIQEFSDTYTLSSKESEMLRREGYFREIKGTDEDHEASFAEDKLLAKIAIEKKQRAEAEAKAFAEGRELEKPPSPGELLRRKKREEARQIQAEKQTLFCRRFPEDYVSDNYEFGQMSAWGIIGLRVPNVNLFVDDKDHGAGDEIFKAENFEDEPDLDEKYTVHTAKRIKPIADDLAVPMDRTDLYDDMKDWDIVRAKKSVRNRGFFATMMAAKARSLEAGDDDDDENTFEDFAVVDREIRWKVCKFAELFLSEEVSSNCRVMHWDVLAYKEMNRLKDSDQGRLAQNLAMSCNLNPPDGFSRISEWTLGVSINVYDDPPEEEMNRVVKQAVKTVEFASHTISGVQSVVSIGKYLDVFRRNGDERILPSAKSVDQGTDRSRPFNDRVVQFLGESLVASRNRILLSDCELSVYGRVGFRSIVRALRRQNCTFVLPSIFVAPKSMYLTHLDLSRNEFDCGDCILIGEIFLYQSGLVYCNLSYNRIGSRGMTRMAKLLKEHESIATFIVNHNRIGPACGKEIGVLLKVTKTLKVLEMSHNRMGELVRFPTLYSREKIPSSVRDIFMGLRGNKTLQQLDVSYNHLGPQCANYIPFCVSRHPCLHSLNISGNDIGANRGAAMLFALAGESGGDKVILDKLKLYEMMKKKSLAGEDITEGLGGGDGNEEGGTGDGKDGKKGSPGKRAKRLSPAKANAKPASKGLDLELKKGEKEDKSIFRPLAYIGLADNQLGYLSGHGIACLLRKNKFLTCLDVSGNSLGYAGTVAVADGLEKVYGLIPRDFVKLTQWKIEEMQYTGRNAKPRPKLYTHLMCLNMARNGMGPEACGTLLRCLSSPNCTITELDLSGNPLGIGSEKGGPAFPMGLDARLGLSTCRTLMKLNLDRTIWNPAQVVTMLGGVTMNMFIRELDLSFVRIDEPSCLQLAHVIHVCESLNTILLIQSNMGPKGSLMILNRIFETADRFVYVDLTGNKMGPTCCVCLEQIIRHPDCSINTLRLADNIFMDAGAERVCKGIAANSSLTDVDLSNNLLGRATAELLAEAARGLYINGRKVSDCNILRFSVSDNPDMGYTGTRILTRALTMGKFEHVEIANIGAGPRSASIIAEAVRDVTLTWRYLDISGNNLSRVGLNEIFWGMRQNRKIRVLKCGDNKAGLLFASEEDNVLKHGISLHRAIRSNIIIRDLDLSYNGMSSNAGALLFDAMVDNFTIRRLNVRGNAFDDDVASMLSDLLRLNDILTYIDLGDNKLGFNCCFSIAEGIEVNRACKTLCIDNNELGNAGTATMEAFCRALMMNHCLRTLVMDRNKLAADWGIALSDTLARNNTLVRVSLRDNRFDAKSGRALANAYAHAPFLMELGLSADEVGDEVWSKLISISNTKRSLEGTPENSPASDYPSISISSHPDDFFDIYE